jgi:hypothetical protein
MTDTSAQQPDLEQPNLCSTCESGLVRLVRLPIIGTRKRDQEHPLDHTENFCTVLREPAYDLQGSVVECTRYVRRPE